MSQKERFNWKHLFCKYFWKTKVYEFKLDRGFNFKTKKGKFHIYFPPKKSRSFDSFTGLTYDGHVYSGLFLWYVNFSTEREWTESDLK